VEKERAVLVCAGRVHSCRANLGILPRYVAFPSATFTGTRIASTRRRIARRAFVEFAERTAICASACPCGHCRRRIAGHPSDCRHVCSPRSAGGPGVGRCRQSRAATRRAGRACDDERQRRPFFHRTLLYGRLLCHRCDVAGGGQPPVCSFTRLLAAVSQISPRLGSIRGDSGGLGWTSRRPERGGILEP
jgi:hypothetical protein